MRVVCDKVLVLKARYKENDDEIMGAFKDQDALLEMFAECVAADHGDLKPVELAKITAKLSAALVSNDSDCIDGRTSYWIEEFDVEESVKPKEEED